MLTAPPRLPGWLATAPWADPGLSILDDAVLGEVRLLILGHPGGDARYFAPVLGDTDACRTGAFDRAVVDAMRAGLTLPTRAGHSIDFRGTPEAYTGGLAFDPGWSSNSLSLLDLRGTACAHKTYRRITPGSREPGLLRALSGSGQTQKPLGEYAYRTATDRVPLGMIYEYADGDGLDVPLRDNLHATWAGRATADDLAAALTGAGAFLREFHGELARRLGPAPPVRADDVLAETRDRIAELAPVILADDGYPMPARRAVLDALYAGCAEPVDWPAGASHGDLHLSHFLRTVASDGGWRMVLIDLSTPPLDPADPRHSAQSPWQDAVALLRGLACFTADEYAARAARDLAAEPAAPDPAADPVPGKEDVCRWEFLRAAGLPPDRPGWTDDRLARLDRLRSATVGWQNRISDLFLRGYAPAVHPAWRLLRTRRILHELAYAYEHERTYYAAITLRHAVEQSGS
ncbi:hypothetical protein [Hamadaea tsunoensis]|uniref:hypothetical protein n=1 Tax=Hamadaea tsunoensis TaxID=53368 RepID=UPI000413E2E1|nr:hypothetical protein [Hamadaea tsunoensis]